MQSALFLSPFCPSFLCTFSRLACHASWHFFQESCSSCAKILDLFRKKNVTKLSLTLISAFMVIGVLWSMRSSIDSICPFLYALLIFSSPLIILAIYCRRTLGKKMNLAILIPLGFLSILPLMVLGGLIVALGFFLIGRI